MILSIMMTKNGGVNEMVPQVRSGEYSPRLVMTGRGNGVVTAVSTLVCVVVYFCKYFNLI